MGSIQGEAAAEALAALVLFFLDDRGRGDSVALLAWRLAPGCPTGGGDV
jgi:hypothetical protein